MFALVLLIVCNMYWTIAQSNQISCESVKTGYWAHVSEQKTCYLSIKTSIASSDLLIGNQRDDTMHGLNFIGNDKIDYLPIQTYTNFPNLIALGASSCAIKSISKENFENLSKLKELLLNRNQIKIIDRDAFEDLVNVEWIDLRHNKLKEINGEMFRSLTNLIVVWLRGNKCIDEDFIADDNLGDLVKIVSTNCGLSSQCDKTFSLANQSNPNFGTRIIGGTNTERGQYPFLAAIFLLEGSKFICGGSLISNQHVLTAAHCVKNPHEIKADRPPKEFSVLLGRYNLDNAVEPGFVQKEVAKIVTHHDWTFEEGQWDADISVLILDSTVPFNDYIRPVCIPTNPEEMKKHDHGYVVGWGKTETKAVANTPSQVKVRNVNENVCLRQDPAFRLISSERTFCAGGKGAGPCHGDSGGGFYVEDERSWMVKGIVSASLIKANNIDCNVDKYSVYTTVADFHEWIMEVLHRSLPRNEQH